MDFFFFLYFNFETLLSLTNTLLSPSLSRDFFNNMPPTPTPTPTPPPAVQFGSFFNKPVEELQALEGGDAEYWAGCGLEAGGLLEELEASVGEGWVRGWAHWRWPVLQSGFTFVNHGAFGAALPPLSALQQRFAEIQQRQPLIFFDRILFPFAVHAQRRLARYLHCTPALPLLLFPNATYALNCILQNLAKRQPKCVIFSTTYGAVKKMARHYFGDANVHTVDISIADALGWSTEGDAVECVARRLPVFGEDVRCVYLLEAISSNSAVCWPYGEIAVKIKERHRNSYVVVDAAHECGQMRANMENIFADGAVDAWVGNGHKWLACPSGVGFAVLRGSDAEVTAPLVVSHGSDGVQSLSASVLWHGHVSYTAWLAVPWVLDFWEAEGRNVAKYLAFTGEAAVRLLQEMWGGGGGGATLHAAVAAPLLRLVELPVELATHFPEAAGLQDLLHHTYKIECPIKKLDGRLFVRISVFLYNTVSDFERLGNAVNAILRDKTAAKL